MTARTCPDWPELMEVAPDLQFKHYTVAEAQLPSEVLASVSHVSLGDVEICCDLEHHVFNPGHTDAEVCDALRESHWFDVHEWSTSGPGTEEVGQADIDLPLRGRGRRLGRRLGHPRVRFARADDRRPLPRRLEAAPARLDPCGRRAGDARRRRRGGARGRARPRRDRRRRGRPVGRRARLRPGRRARRGGRGRPRGVRRSRARRERRTSRARRPARSSASRAAGLALVEAADGTTNALSLPDPSVFAPLYGPGSAERFRAHAPFATVAIPELAADVDSDEDLERLAAAARRSTRALLAVHA